MWPSLPDDLVTRVVQAVPACALAVAARLDRRCPEIVRPRLARLRKLTESPFHLPSYTVLGKEHDGARVVLLTVGMLLRHAEITVLTAACANDGALALVEQLFLTNNLIGDAGMKAFAEACTKGALPQLKVRTRPNPRASEALRALTPHTCSDPWQRLFLGRNQIGDAGLISLVEACAAGAPAKLNVRPDPKL